MEHTSAARIEAWRARAQQALQALPGELAEPRLQEAMRYSLLAGGKRLRPVLLYCTLDALGGSKADAADCDRIACALECIHTYSLIHDDLPAMDNDDLRRGLPTAHRAFDEGTAILAGDALHTLAFELVCAASTVAADLRLQLLATLAGASGARGMVGGQAIDLAHVGQSMDLAALEQMHQLKTGALIQAALRMGGLLAGAGPAQLARLEACARHLGLAFQVRDDILDQHGDVTALGKHPGSDAAQAKPTYCSLLGVAAAQLRSEELLGAALQELEGFDERADTLRELARYIVQRDR